MIKSIAVIGSHADVGVLSGGGSDQVDAAGGNPVPGRGGVYQPSAPLKAIREKAPKAKVDYDAGTDPAAAAKLAASAEVAIVFVNQHTTEGRDVNSLSLPDNQDELVAKVAAANPHTIVVLETGGPITMPWIDKVSGVLEVWYPGIRGGEATANILFGAVNPSGKLPVTFPKSEADLPQPVLPGWRPRAPGTLRCQLYGGSESWLQVVRRGEQGAAIRVRLRSFLHHVRILATQSGGIRPERDGELQREEHRQSGRR